MICMKCNGDMIGDGYTMVYHCEYASDEKYEPEAGPIFCDYDEDVDVE